MIYNTYAYWRIICIMPWNIVEKSHKQSVYNVVELNNYIVRSHRDVIGVTNTATRRIKKA